MPETFTPVTLSNDTGQKLNAAYFNRLETNIETFDDRIAAVELGVAGPVTLTYATTVTPNAAAGSLFRIVATGNLTLGSPINGTDGQVVLVEVQASGADRAVTLPGGSISIIPSGQWFQYRLCYHATGTVWSLGGTTYGDEQAQDAAAALFAAGTHSGISYSYNDTTGAISSTVSGGGGAESATFVGNKVITGRFGVNATPTSKQPVNMITSMSGSTVSGTQDKVAFALGANITGNFASDAGSNPGFFWGMNLFATTGSAAGDGAGLTDIVGGLIEMSIQTPAGTTLPHVIGLHAEAAFFGASSGATVTQMESMRVSAPKRKDGASSGTVGTAYCLFIEDPDAYNVGVSATKFALFVEGGVTRLQGSRLEIEGDLLSFNGTLALKGDYSGNGRIDLTTNGIGFYGVTPVARQTLVASPTTTQIRTALIALGLVQ